MDSGNKQATKPRVVGRSRQRVAAGRLQARRAATTSRKVQKNTASTSPLANKKFPLPKYYAPERPQRIVRKRSSRLALALRISGVIITIFILTGGFLVWKGYTKFHKVFRGTTTVAALSKKTVAPSLLKGEGDGRVNILLLGVGGPGHDGPDLTDTIVVLSVDPVNNTATMVSVPRDLWVDMPVNYFGKQQKINAAYESGKYHYVGRLDPSNKNAAAVEAGFDSIDTVMKNVLDVNINYHLLVNFQAFRQAIDTVGGVTVNVPTPLVDPTMAWENHWNSTLAPAGVQQMDGVKALLYARSRETTSDFARAERQRQILVALKDKVLTAGTLSNPAKIDGLMNAFGDNVFSDLSTQGATRLVSIMQKVGDNKIKSIGFTDDGHKLVTTDHIGNTSVVRPLAGFGSYADIQTYVRSQIPDGYIVKEHAPIAVFSPTSASATTTGALLTSYGYTVTSTAATTGSVTTPIVVDLSNGKYPYTAHYLESRYGVKVVKKLPAGVALPPQSTAKFAILTSK
jgi:polyisoprenyl-teichoic acid--peptidoglycan teichoic acid transferase